MNKLILDLLERSSIHLKLGSQSVPQHVLFIHSCKSHKTIKIAEQIFRDQGLLTGVLAYNRWHCDCSLSQCQAKRSLHMFSKKTNFSHLKDTSQTVIKNMCTQNKTFPLSLAHLYPSFVSFHCIISNDVTRGDSKVTLLPHCSALFLCFVC